MDLVFAGRLTSAVIVQMLIEQKLLVAKRLVVDFDNVLSKFRLRQLRQTGAEMGLQGRILGRLDARLLRQAEQRIARHWDSIAVCSDEDVVDLARAHRKPRVIKVPNIVDLALLPQRQPDGQFRCLFVGNLGFAPNAHGLKSFIETAWAATLTAVPGATLSIVGFNPPPDLVALARSKGIALHQNVADVRPYYAACDVVIAPILFGGGTRVKIVEAMALGRAVVSTAIGAEGLDLSDGKQILVVETMTRFPVALARLANDAALRASIVAEARAFQQANFSPETLAIALRNFILPDEDVSIDHE